MTCACIKKNRAIEVCGLCERERAEKAEAALRGAQALSEEKCKWFYLRAIEAEAQIILLRGSLRCSGSGDLCKLRPEHKCNACKTLELPVPDLAAEVQDVIEAAQKVITWRKMPLNEVGFDDSIGALEQALSRLDAAMGKK